MMMGTLQTCSSNEQQDQTAHVEANHSISTLRYTRENTGERERQKAEIKHTRLLVCFQIDIRY